MSLIKCKECGNEISKKAEQCPKCGYKYSHNKESSNGCLKLLLLLPLSIIAFLLFGPIGILIVLVIAIII
ncbi:MAG: zinc-ribbon domain-containing protein [Endomicrobium sp.]|jgi:uncharacterized membrane protein YvbJ|nr:zinc-ribbon domain-containing protein [Endomicrobium sp.]